MSKGISKKTVLTILGVILVLGAAAFGYYRKVYQPSHAPAAAPLTIPSLQTAVVYQGDLVVYARGTGTLIARNEIKLGFGSSGTISELNAVVGTQVHMGDVLAVQGNRDQLQAALAANQLAEKQARRALDLFMQDAGLVTAQAQLDLANAQAALQTAEFRRSVQMQGNRASPAMLKAAEAKLQLAQADLIQARGELNQNPKNASLQLNYANAQRVVDTAQANWNWITGHPTEIQLAQLDGEVALATARVGQAQQAWERVKNGPDPDAQALLELQLAQAQADLKVAQRNLDQSIILAPSDGTILTVSETVGRDVSGTFITMADLSQLYLDISMDAADVDKIALQNAVEVSFDALPGQIFSGQIVQLQPGLSTAGSFPTIKGLVALDATATAAYKNLRLGMTATVDVIAGKATGVTIIPIEALHEQAPGQYIVYVVQAGQTVSHPVTIGLKDFASVEIKSGLKVGEVVSTAVVP